MQIQRMESRERNSILVTIVFLVVIPLIKSLQLPPQIATRKRQSYKSPAVTVQRLYMVSSQSLPTSERELSIVQRAERRKRDSFF